MCWSPVLRRPTPITHDDRHQMYDESKYSREQYIAMRIKSGDHHSFAAFYQSYFKALCAFASRFVDAATAEEIAQDTMMSVWENHDKIDITRSLKSLAFTIAHNKAIDCAHHVRVQSRVGRIMEERFSHEFDNPDFYTDDELMRVFSSAMLRLPTDVRKAFEMSRMDNKSHKEIAFELNVSPQTVNYRICQALVQLRSELQEYLPLLLLFLWF